MGNSMSLVEECLRDRDCKRDVHDVALVGGSARIPIVQKMIQEFFNGKEQRFTELVALSSTHTETVLPVSWEGGTMGLERCGRTNLRSVSLWRASDEIAWHANVTLDAES